MLALSSDALLMRWVAAGSDRSGGGAIEREFLLLWNSTRTAASRASEHLDLGREADALARFDELAAVSPIPNPAVRAMAEFERAGGARDWHGVVATYAPTHDMDDRRTLFRMQVTSEDFLANERMLFEHPRAAGKASSSRPAANDSPCCAWASPPRSKQRAAWPSRCST